MPPALIHTASRLKKATPSSWSQLLAGLLAFFLITGAQTSQAEDNSESTSEKSKWIDIYAPPVTPGTPLAEWQIAGIRSVLNHPNPDIFDEGVQLLNELLAAGYDGTPLAQEIKTMLQSPEFSGSKYLLQSPAMEISRRSSELQDVIISQLADGMLHLDSKHLPFLERSGLKSLPLVDRLIEGLLSKSIDSREEKELPEWAKTLHSLAKQSPGVQALIEKRASAAKSDKERLKLDVFIGWDQDRVRDTCRKLFPSTDLTVKFHSAHRLGREGVPILAELLLLDASTIEIYIGDVIFTSAAPYADDVFVRLALALQNPGNSDDARFFIAHNIIKLAKGVSENPLLDASSTNAHLLEKLDPASAVEVQLLMKIILKEDISAEVQALWQTGLKSLGEIRQRELFILGEMGYLAKAITPSLIKHLKETKTPRQEIIELAGKVAGDSTDIAPLLMRHFVSSDNETAQTAGRAFFDIGTRAIGILPELVALSQSSPDHTKDAGALVALLGSAGARPIVKLLNTGTPSERSQALNMLAGNAFLHFSFPWSKKTIMPEMQDITTEVGRRNAQFAKALTDALPSLTRLLISGDEEAGKAAQAILALGDAGTPCLPHLLEILNSNHPSNIKVHALDAMGNMKIDVNLATPCLERMLDSQESEILRSVIANIAKMDSPPATIVRKMANLLNHGPDTTPTSDILNALSELKSRDPLVTDALSRWIETNPLRERYDYKTAIAALRATRSSSASLAPVLVTTSLLEFDNKLLVDGVPGDDPSALALYLAASLQLNAEKAPATRLTAHHRFADSAPSAFIMNFLGATPEGAAKAKAWLIYQAGDEPNLLWLQKTLQHSRKANNELISTASLEDAVGHLQFLGTILPKVARSPHFAELFPSQHNMLIRTLENEALRLADSLPASPESLQLLRDLAPAAESQGTKALFQQRLSAMQSQLTTRQTLKILLVTVGPVALYFLVLLAIYRWRPAWLVPLALAAGRPGIPLLLRSAACSRRALDAWLWPQLNGAKARLKGKAEVRPHLTYVERPVAVHEDSGQEIKTLNSTHEAAALCRTQLGSTVGTIGQISGIGGTGKSALVTQLGLNFLAPAENDEDRRTRTPILPLLAYQLGTRKVASRLQQACEELLHEGTVPGWLLTRLLATGRAVPVFEAVSEMSTGEFTNLKEWLEDASCPASLCLITTRRTFAFSDRKSVELRPVLVGRNEVNAFTLGYLKQRSASA